ncbi:MAG: glycosyltransferase [Nitrospira bacterium HGW-Nitrospira-1]|nr:MAG: glycosyltransferase [Nitrospira bacterium HGW-Nitrospira-1]
MKILNVNHTMDPFTGGGTAERTFQMSRYLVANGIQCSVLTIDTNLPPERKNFLEGEKVIALPPLLKRFFIPKFSYGKIKRVVEDSDIVHLMGHWTFLNAFVYVVARRAGKPYAVCPAGALPIFGRSRLLKKGYNALIGRNIIRQAQAHIAIAGNEISQFADYGITPDQITTIPNGVNPLDYQNYDIAGFRDQAVLGDAPYILFVGRLNPIKGPDLLLHAFCRVAPIHRDYHLVFAGPDGGMEASLKSDVRGMGLRERVHFIGYAGGKDKAAAYHGASFVAVPSRQEAMSIVVLEAGICGKPVLMTDQCGFPALGQVGGGCIVAATEDGIAEGLLDIMQNADRIREMGERLRRYVEIHYSWDIIAQSYLTLFRKMLHNPVV